MAIRTTSQAIAASKLTKTNKVGSCQATTRGWYNAPSVGDVDGDGDADAMDGWKSEPESAKHHGDRKPPAGYPVAFSGGTHGYGHRAMTVDDHGTLRSIDMQDGKYAPGITGYCTIADIEKHMGLTYLGWSSTIDRIPIVDDVQHPDPPKPPTKPKKKTRIDEANIILEKAYTWAVNNGKTKRAELIRQKINAGPKH